MKIKNLMLAGVMLVAIGQAVMAEPAVRASDAKSKMTSVQALKNQSTKVQSPKKAGEKSPIAKKAIKMLTPTTSEVRVYKNDDTDEIEGIRVTISQGKCTSPSSFLYKKGLKEMQAKAEKIAEQAMKNDPDFTKPLKV